jgi:MFS transporter, PHS family, inorganic phosphate transporter
MVAAVFLMQPVGQALAQLVNHAVLAVRDSSHSLQDMRCGLDSLHDFECRQAVDGIWRIVVGVGAIPALLAIMFRFMLPDSGLYNLEVKMKSTQALQDFMKIYGGAGSSSSAEAIQISQIQDTPSQHETPIQFSRADMHRFFIQERNWIYLLGTASTWFILDVALYGFGLDNRSNLAGMWATTHADEVDSRLSCWETDLPGGQSVVPTWVDGLPIWQTDPTKPCNTIYDVLMDQTKHYLLTVSIGSILGCAAFIFAANFIPRRQFLTGSFVILSILFGITGGVYYRVHHSSYASATPIMVGICHFAFNFGMMIFQLPGSR